jgi:hypothetical protein
VAACPTASADLVKTSDGKWMGLPRGVTLGPTEKPGPDLLRLSADFKVEATYETVKARGWSTAAGLVSEIWASDMETLPTFKEGMAQYDGNLPLDAVESFAAAAEEATGFGKQAALYLHVLASADAYASRGGSTAGVLGAIDRLLAEFPKSYYLADVQILRAKIVLGDPAAVSKALDAVRSAPGMNLRDVYRAELWRIVLELERNRKWAEAKQAYEALMQQIDRGDRAQGGDVRARAQVGVGTALLRVEPPQPDEAKAAFEKVLSSASDPDALAMAHAGLGDVDFLAAKRLQEAKKLPEAKERLVDATLHYLRVTLVYRDLVSDLTPVYAAYENQAKAFVALFDQSGGKDCAAASHAYAAYWDLHLMLGGAEKKRIIRDANDFNQRRKAAGCK